MTPTESESPSTDLKVASLLNQDAPWAWRFAELTKFSMTLEQTSTASIEMLAENATLKARASALEAAIREHKEAGEFVTGESYDRKLWSALEQ